MSAALTCLLSFAASAQQADPAERPPEPEPQTIIVTGERVARSLRDTASSVAVVTAEDIESGAAPDRVEQLLEAIPNVQLGSGGEGVTIRGQDTTGAMRDLPAFLGGNRPRTTLVVDGRAVGFTEYVFGIAPLWDVERVEVFRTPQTTTQGRNSIAGAIFVHSQAPSFEWEARTRALAGNLHTRQLSAVASGPLVDDQIAFRVSGDWRKSRPSSQIADTMRGANPNRDEYGVLRFRLLAEPEALREGRIDLTFAHSQAQMPQIVGVRAPFRERRDPLASYGVFRTNVESMTGSIAFKPADGVESRTLISAGKAKARRFAPPGLGETRALTTDWSAESIVDWTPAPSLRLIGGAAYTRTSLDQRIDLSVLSGIGTFDDRQRSLGLFGEVVWRPVERLEITGGLRFQDDRQVRTGALAGVTDVIPLDYARSFRAWLPKLSVAYELSDTLVAGLLAQRAYNPGGATLRFDTGMPDEFAAEKLWNYELFARATLGNGISARVNVFRSDIEDAQRSRAISILAPTGRIVTFADLFNVPKARTQGMEAELDWRLSENMSARAGIGLLDTEIRGADEVSLPLLGNDFERSPGLTLAVSADWRPVERVAISGGLRHHSGYFSSDDNSPQLRVGPATTIDARASFRARALTLFAYARNLLDAFHMRHLLRPTHGIADDPREIGIGVEASF